MIQGFLKTLSYVELLGIAVVLVSMVRAREHRRFIGLTSLLSARLLDSTLCLMFLWLWRYHLMAEKLAYAFYFYVYWAGFALEACLAFYMVLNIFRVSMAPLKGLQTLGMLVFRWAAASSLILATVLSMSAFRDAASLIIHFLFKFQQVSSLITLCLLMFVCFAIRPLGLTLRSRVFGVALGLGLMASASLVQVAWFVPTSGKLFNLANLVADIGGVTALAVWAAYFIIPEPKRSIIVLPTTSPFLRWNQISEVLGDNPGFVAIAGVPPELLAPAEVEVMIRASVKMRQLEEFDPEASPTTLNSLSA